MSDGRSEAPFLFMLMTVIPASLFLRQVILCQLHFQMTQFEILCKHIFSSKCQGIALLFTINKNRPVVVSFSVMYSSLIVFSLDSLSFPLTLCFALYATCRCWDYCCAYLVRCWILFMTLSCVPTVKRRIKHLYLPQMRSVWAHFFAFQLLCVSKCVNTRLWLVHI